jgi:transaldolase
MAIFIDSANLAEVQAAQALGWVSGITTNPVLLAKTGGDPKATLAALARLEMGHLFYQLTAPTMEGMLEEMKLAAKLVGRRLVLKVPPTPLGFRFVSQVVQYPCCVTAVFSAAQALAARAARAQYVAVYVNRATRLLGDDPAGGVKLVREIAEVLEDSGTEIVAASLKSAAEACASAAAGAAHLTLAYRLLESLMSHPLSEQAVTEFSVQGIGLHSSPG